MSKLKFVIIFLQLFSITIMEANVTCRNENGESIDWFYLYKLPASYSDSEGLNYLFLSSDNYENGWQLSTKLINESHSFPGQTLSSIIQKNIYTIAYNDEPPNRPVDAINGHSKGVIAGDHNSQFWLIHSVPKYPSFDENMYAYPETGTRFGQSFLCITLTTSLDKIIQHLKYNQPNIYFTNSPKGTNITHSNLIYKEWKQDGPFWNQISFKSANGIEFVSFAKGKQFHKDLYEDFVAPALNTNLLVETWRNGEGNLPSNCSHHIDVLNVSEIKINAINFSFKSTHDHSKWAVSKEDNTNWICVGDINRQKHQLERGGGTVCQSHPKLSKIYRDSIEKFEPCN